ncbi:MAG: hypothetical protein ACRCYR_03780 [Phycicoccus sp.]
MNEPANPPRVLVGISGPLRAGKDTAGAALVADGFTRASFADKLRAFLYALNPVIVQDDVQRRLVSLVDDRGWERCKDTYPEVRALLQRCGTDAGRNVLGANVWVNAAMSDLPAGDVVFTDVRFPNEADAIRAAGGIVVRVERAGYEPDQDSHLSETALHGYAFDFTLHNHGTVEQLHDEARSVVRSWRSVLAPTPRR